jgi:hypothetical protein
MENLYIWAMVTQESGVTHWLLVLFKGTGLHSSYNFVICFRNENYGQMSVKGFTKKI